jgi:hypothetical protein
MLKRNLLETEWKYKQQQLANEAAAEKPDSRKYLGYRPEAHRSREHRYKA